MQQTSEDPMALKAQIQRRLSEAQQAEQARLDAEQVHRRIIAEAEAQLALIDEQERVQEIRRLRDDIEQLCEVNASQVQTLFSVLNSVTVSDAIIEENLSQIDSTYQQQINLINHLLGEVSRADDQPYPWAGRAISSLSVEELDAKRAYDQRAIDVPRQLLATTRFAWPSWAALAVWVSEAANPTDRRKRTGRAYMYLGELLNPPPNFRPDDEIRRRFKAQSGLYRGMI